MFISLLKFSRKTPKLLGEYRMRIKDIQGWGKLEPKLVGCGYGRRARI